MGLNKPHVLILLIIMVILVSDKPSLTEGRTLSLISNQGYSNILATLGVVCKCCDGIGGTCTSTWKKSCNNLKCSPWKSH
uniref:Uncharacterized protein LOC101514220 n=1 Tax=Cicer arietinum TaxID=3827 RepID=A0A1S2XQG0_CICAR|nr:uncharacterized protein LOC101514220 [Cicer arietinum]